MPVMGALDGAKWVSWIQNYFVSDPFSTVERLHNSFCSDFFRSFEDLEILDFSQNGENLQTDFI